MPDFDGEYEISNLGRLRRIDGKMMQPHIDDQGYPRTRIKGKPRRIRRLVAIAFVAGRADGLEVCYNDGDKLNAAASNLRWDTRSSNMLDVVKHGGHNFASRDVCGNGHPYSERAPMMRAGRARICRTCAYAARDVSKAATQARGLEPGDPRHGTLTAHHDHACRCERCLEAYRAYRREYRARKNRKVVEQ